MAKLSAHGTEIARLTYRTVEPSTEFDRRLYGDDFTERRYEIVLSFRSDGHILKRETGLDTHPNEPEGSRYRKHAWPWKLWKRLDDPKRDTARRQTALAQQWAIKLENAGRLIDIKAPPHA